MQRARRRLIMAAALGVAAIGLAAGSDFVIGSFWSRHAMVTSLTASLIVLVVTVAVLNEWLDRRDRRRWRVLAQYVLLALVQDARVTWTSVVEEAEQRDLDDDNDALLAAATRALDTAALSAAIASLLIDAERRRRLGEAVATIARHSGAVIRGWAAVMVGSGPYTDVFDRHVELQSRLDWLSTLLALRDPDAQRSIRDAKLARSSVASEHGDLAGDGQLRDQLVATTQLAVRLDYESRKLAFELVPFEWWQSRTAEVVRDLAVLEP